MLSGPLKEWGISAAAIQLYGMKLVEAEREGRIILLYHTIAAPYEMMVTDVTNAQYARYLGEALAKGAVKVDGDRIVGYYRGGSKNDYGYNLRVWTRNNVRPDYASPSVGFRCAR